MVLCANIFQQILNDAWKHGLHLAGNRGLLLGDLIFLSSNFMSVV